MERSSRELLKAVQDGIPLAWEPFKIISEKIDVPEKEILENLNEMNDNGIIRRFSANINQSKLGITANAVVVWNIPENKMAKVIPSFMSHPEISHLYERVIYPGRWEYNLYSVIHGYNEDSVKKFAEEIADEIGISDYQVLFSKKRFKGTSSRLAKQEDLK